MFEDIPGRSSTTASAIHLRQLVYLREVARQGTVTRAAEVLSVSQPAVSQSLADLERRLGIALFEPAGRQRRLTDDGREVLAFAERVLADSAALQERLEARARGEQGSIRVGMIDAASLYVLPRAIQRYREEYPGVELSLFVETSNELVRRLRAFDLDLVFVVGPPDGDLRAEEVSREVLYLYAPPGQRPDALGPDADWVLYPEGSRTRAVIDAGLARLGILPQVTLESHNPEVLKQMVALGLGWSVLPLTVAEAEGDLRSSRGPLVAERPLVGLRRSMENPRVEAFLRIALESSAGTSVIANSGRRGAGVRGAGTGGVLRGSEGAAGPAGPAAVDG